MYSTFGSALAPSYAAARWGQPEDIAGTAIYLASSGSDFVTGETIRVDGGYAIR